MPVQKTYNLLLIEDNTIDARVIGKHLSRSEQARFKVEHASRLSEAFDILKNFEPDIVLTDLNLPDSEDLDTLAKVMERVPGLPVVVLTGHNNAEMGLKAMQYGAQEYVNKGDLNAAMIERVLLFAYERHRTQQDLRRREKQLRTIVDNNLDSILIINKKEAILYANPAAERFLEQSREELVGQYFSYSVQTDKIEEIRVKDRVAEVRAVNIVWEGEEALLIIMHDVTERLRGEKLKREAEALLNIQQLAAGIAHEFSQPIQVITTSLDLMVQDADPKKRLGKLREMVDRVTGLVKNLRDLTGIERKPYLDYEILDITGSSARKELERKEKTIERLMQKGRELKNIS